MKIIAASLVVLALSCGVVAFAAPLTKKVSASELADNQVWSLNQKGIVLGEFDVLVGKTGLRAVCSRSGITFIARPPLWHVTGFSRRSNSIWRPDDCQFNPAATILKSLAITGMPEIGKIPLIQNGLKNVSGFQCKNLVTSAKWTEERSKQLEQKEFSRRHPRAAEYQGAAVDLPLPACRIPGADLRCT